MKVIIVPIVKKRGLDPTQSSNYRPIALASIFSKIVEMTLLTLYSLYLQTTDNQIGYKKGSGTELAIYTVKQVAHHYVRHNTPVYACYLDASKAFDKVNHFLLLKKLCDRGLSGTIVGFLKFWFRSQRFSVRWGSTLSEPFRVFNSVRQGGQASPTFFSVHMDHLSELLTATGLGCHVGNRVVNHAIDADDIILLVTTISALKKLLQICEDYGKSHDLQFNPKKSVLQCFSDYTFDSTRLLIKLCGKTIQWHDTVRYLGYDINCKNRDLEEIMRRRELYCNANLIKSRFGSCASNVRLYLFRTYFSTIYCSSIWCPVSHNVLNQFRVAYNDSFRIIMKYGRRQSASQMFADYKTRDFWAMRRLAAFSLLRRIAESPNKIILSITNSKFFTESSISIAWKSLLFNIS